MSDRKPMGRPRGRRTDTEARARVIAVLDAQDCSRLTHERVAELASVSESMVKAVRKERGETAGVRERKPRTRRPKPTPLAQHALTKQQGVILTRVIDLAMGGRDTRRLLEIRALLRTTTGLELQAAASLAQGAT